MESTLAETAALSHGTEHAAAESNPTNGQATLIMDYRAVENKEESSSREASTISAHVPVILDKMGHRIDGRQGSSLATCIANLSNTIIGAGMLSLPHAYAESGYIMGTILLCMGALCSGFALNLLASCVRIVGIPSSFYTVAKRAVPQFTYLIDTAVSIKCFGVAAAYLVVVGDMMSLVAIQAFDVEEGFVTERRFWIVLFFVIFVVPLAFLKTYDSLKFTSVIGMLFVVYLVGVVVCYAVIPQLDECSGLQTCAGPTASIKFGLGTLKTFSIFVYGFTCHQNMFGVMNEIHNGTERRVNIVIVSSIGIAWILYLIFAVFGYYTYGSNVKSDVLSTYPHDNVGLSISRAAVALHVTFCYPLQSHPARACITTLWIAVAARYKRFRMTHHNSPGLLEHRTVADTIATDQAPGALRAGPENNRSAGYQSSPDGSDAARAAGGTDSRDDPSETEESLRNEGGVRRRPRFSSHQSVPSEEDDKANAIEDGDDAAETGSGSSDIEGGGIEPVPLVTSKKDRLRGPMLPPGVPSSDDDGHAAALGGGGDGAILVVSDPSAAIRSATDDGPMDSNPREAEFRRLVITAMLVLGTLAISMVVDDLGLILSLVGATGSTLTSYILPGLMYVRLHREWTWKKIGAMTLFVAGLLIVVTCLTAIFL